MSAQIEYVDGPDGEQIMRIPRDPEIVALSSAVKALSAAVAEGPQSKVRAVLDAGARESNAAAIAAFTAATDRQVAAITAAADRQEAGNRLLAAAFDGLTAAIKAMPPISVNPTFAPQITAQAGEVRVVAELPPRQARTATVTTDAAGNQQITLE